MLEPWRLLHFLTGHAYVHLEQLGEQMIRRVRYTHAGRAYVIYLGPYLVWLDDPDGWTITPLTRTASCGVAP